ncbi:hypothetical protein NO976_02472 [Planktothrix agardhii]|jgi:hypothetical protein|uniref:Uncharacterized protein n=1 Tax=Planktothrix agardhii TaxID=1160 RepID=A0A1J1JCB8_PLAAG|nr:hypothetical protein [Planktothrix agardhii]MCF3609218.1 hypothetical protein [Planktothrix agardhii 1033]BBD56402.1 hypothetical protein NIES204_37300 [Planktothrix agardhii NIES-204]MCB8750634.1 hypothetical protein [Planktothrix agardhii 1810]MCB8764865.1 hypothetical protein [Planktothrix agardhii 1809]MCB8778505.1 hypothetical protein [Planktothrix agardhii 1031]
MLVLSQLWEGEIIDSSSGDDLTPQPPSLRGNGEQEVSVSGDFPQVPLSNGDLGGSPQVKPDLGGSANINLGSNLNTQRQNLQQQLNSLQVEEFTPTESVLSEFTQRKQF